MFCASRREEKSFLGDYLRFYGEKSYQMPSKLISHDHLQCSFRAAFCLSAWEKEV